MKRTKLIANLCLLVLTIACLTFGVYSAVSTKFTASGTITFNAYNLDIDVMCTITGITGGTKTFYGTTFLSNTNSVSATRTDYVADGKIRTDATHFDLSSNGSVMQLGNLVFDEISNDNIEISIEFSFTNYSTFMAKAQGLAKIDATTKLDCQYGGATIMNQYATDGTNSGKFTIKISPKENASATTSADNGLSISINVSPNGLSKIGNNVCDTSVCSKTLYQKLCVDTYANGLTWNEYVSLEENSGLADLKFEQADTLDGFTYDISKANVVAKSSAVNNPTAENTESSQLFFAPDYINNVIVAESVFGKQVDSIANNYQDIITVSGTDVEYLGVHFKSIYLPTGMTQIQKYAFCGVNCITEHISIPNSVTTIAEGAFAGCSFNTLVLPKNLTQINKRVFWDCFPDITYGDKVERICTESFFTIYSGFKFVIPASVTTIEPDITSNESGKIAFENPNGWQVSDSENGSYTPVTGLTSEATQANSTKYMDNSSKWWKRVSA